MPRINFQMVEQDRHLLKRKLTSIESEYELKVLELQNDISELNNKLSAKDNLLKQTEREKSALVEDLNIQNTRLTSQLKEYCSRETQLVAQMDALKEQYVMGKKSLQDHMNGVNTLKDELELITEKNLELEKRVHLIASERDNTVITLEEATDRILQLERHIKEQDIRYQQSIKDYSLPHEKLSIEERLGGMYAQFVSCFCFVFEDIKLLYQQSKL